MSPPLSGIHQLHQPSPITWLVAVPRMPYTAEANSGYFSANSRLSQSFTPFQRDHAAAVGWALFDLHQAFLRARIAPMPEASTTQRARIVLVPSPFFTVSVCSAPEESCTLSTLAGRINFAP